MGKLLAVLGLWEERELPVSYFLRTLENDSYFFPYSIREAKFFVPGGHGEVAGFARTIRKWVEV